MALQTIDVDQHLFESRTTWSDYIDPAQRADALSISDDDAGWPWLTWRGRHLTPLEVPIPERSTLIGEDRLRRLARRTGAGAFRGARARLLPPRRPASGLARRVRGGRCGHVPELRPAVGAAAGVGPRRAAGQRAGLQPLHGRRLWRGCRTALRRGARPAARPGLGGRGDQAGAGPGRPPGHDRPGARGREAAVASRLRPGLGGVQRRGRGAGLPRVRVREPAPPGLATGRAGGRRAALRLDLLVPGPCGRPGQPHPERRARTIPRPAHRRGRADGELGAELPPAHRRGVGLLHPAARRAVPQAGRAPVGLLPAPGAGGRAALRDAQPARAQGGRRHVHDRQRLAARRRGGRSRWRPPSEPWRGWPTRPGPNILGANAAWLLGL